MAQESQKERWARELEEALLGARGPVIVFLRSSWARSTREVWLVRAGEERRELLEALRLNAPFGVSSDAFRLDEDADSLSAEAMEISSRAGVSVAILSSIEQGWGEAPNNLDEARAMVLSLTRSGEAIGPVELPKREDGRLYEIDAAEAALALSERWALEAHASDAEAPKGPGARL